MSFLLSFLWGLASLFILFYVWFKYQLGYWKRQNVFSPPASFPFGHISFDRVHQAIFSMNVYNKYKKHPLVGMLLFYKNTVQVNDIEMIKNILTKDFVHFQGHMKPLKNDPLEQHLFNLEGEEWKRMRVKLTPTFTSSKMKYMFDTMLSCTQEMVDYLNEEGKISKVYDIKELIAKLGINVIGSCAFGIEINSFKNQNTEFRRMGKIVNEMTLRSFWFNVLAFCAPEVLSFFNITRNRPEVITFFQKLVKETVEYREKNDIKRNDFLQLLIEMKNADENSGNQLSLAEITAQVFVFYNAGFETSATAATYTLYELSKNQVLREKIQSQIDEALAENDGKITYELLNNMTFLTNLVKETLRMYPPFPQLIRTCSKDYKVPGTSSIIEKGTFTIIPTYAIQRDPEIYPDPENFDPDRFNSDNTSDKHLYSYLPFGEGPRNCIGSRFAMMQVKLAMLLILKNFNVELSDKTKLPLEYDPNAFLLHTKGPMFLILTPRKP